MAFICDDLLPAKDYGTCESCECNTVKASYKQPLEKQEFQNCIHKYSNSVYMGLMKVPPFLSRVDELSYIISLHANTGWMHHQYACAINVHVF